MSFLVGIGAALLLTAFLGLGRLAGRFAPAGSRDTPYQTSSGLILGAACFFWVCSWLALIGFASVHEILGLLALGAICAPLPERWLPGRTPGLRTVLERIGSASPSARLVGLAVAVAASAYVWVLPKVNPNDDGVGYLAFAVKVVETGGFGTEPFSERRLFALGSHYPFLGSVQWLLGTRWLSVAEPFLGLALALALVVENMSALGWRSLAPRIAGAGVVLLSPVLFRPIVNLSSVYLVSPLLAWASLQAVATSEEAIAMRSTWRGYLLIGLAAGVAVTLRTIAFPAVAVVLAIAILSGGGRRGRLNATLGVAGGVVVGIAPAALSSFRATGTLLFPLLGLGTHSSRYDATLWPNAALDRVERLMLPIRGVFGDPMLMALGGLMLLVVCLNGRRGRRLSAWRLAIPILAYGFCQAAVSYTTPGRAAYVYGFPLSLAWLLVLAVMSSPRMGDAPAEGSGQRLRRGVGAVVAALALMWVAMMVLEQRALPGIVVRYLDSTLAARASVLALPERERESYREAQRSIPSDATVLVFAPRAYLFDYTRHHVLVLDQPGLAGPDPGWPSEPSDESMAAYLQESGVRFVITPSVRPEHLNHPPGQDVTGWALYLWRNEERFMTLVQRWSERSCAVRYRDAYLVVLDLARGSCAPS